MTPASVRERTVGLALESLGEVPARIRRDPSGQAEFIDGAGEKWDVKAFNSHFPPLAGGFDLTRDADKVDKSLAQGENVMLDTGRLSSNDLSALRNESSLRGWGQRAKWWP